MFALYGNVLPQIKQGTLFCDFLVVFLIPEM